jgi:hypothetical protein
MLFVDRFSYLIFGNKLRDLRMLRMKGASNGGSRGPVYEPFVKDRAPHWSNVAGIHDARVCDLRVSDQKDSQPVQHVVVIAEDFADVFRRRVAMDSTDFVQYIPKLHSLLS